MKVGIIGLGKLGLNLALRIKSQPMLPGYEGEPLELFTWNRSPEKREAARNMGIYVTDTIGQLTAELGNINQRVIFLAVSAGEAIDQVLYGYDGLEDKLAVGDIIVDCANSYFKHSQRRADQMSRKGAFFLDAGVSGTPNIATDGAAFMVGGDNGAFEFVEPVFKALAGKSKYGYFGPAGAGHFIKMIHNGIEYGMMQSLAEGLNILKTSSFSPDLAQLTEVLNSGSTLQGTLMGYANTALSTDKDLLGVVPQASDVGTGSWSVWQALEQGVSATTISSAVFARQHGLTANEYVLKLLQAMRTQFGGGD